MKIFDLLFAISFEFLGEITSVQCISSGEWEVVSRKTRESTNGRDQIFATSGKASKLTLTSTGESALKLLQMRHKIIYQPAERMLRATISVALCMFCLSL